MPKTVSPAGQRFVAELDLFCELHGITMAALCREAEDTARSVVTRWRQGQCPTLDMAERFRAAMDRITALQDVLG